jgi:hypothetical protein
MYEEAPIPFLTPYPPVRRPQKEMSMGIGSIQHSKFANMVDTQGLLKIEQDKKKYSTNNADYNALKC